MAAEEMRILVPLDGSAEAESALGAVMPLARARSARLFLFHVVEEGSSFRSLSYLEKTEKALLLEGMKSRIAGRRLGKPAEEILSYASDKRCDLIAMSTHGRSGFERLRLGSVAEEVLRHWDGLMLVTRPGVEIRPWKRVLAALDGSGRSEQILPEAEKIATEQDGVLDLVRVGLPMVSGVGFGEFPIVIPAEDPMPYLKEVAHRFAGGSVQVRTVALQGRAGTEIVRHAADSEAGLIAMTTHGRTGLPRALMGSIAEDVIRHAPCPVLVRRVVKAPVAVET